MEHLGILQDSLRDRNINHDSDELRAALEGADGPVIASWIDEQLRQESLLTRDEYLQYDALASSEQVGVLFASADAQYLPELDEKELRNAIDELQKSTASIEKHTQTLRKQQEAVASLLKSNRRSASSRASVNQAQHRIWDVEAKQLTTSINELARGLALQAGEVDATIKVAEADLRKTASDMMRIDDGVLTSLQKLSKQIFVDGPALEEEPGTVRHLCARLIKYKVEGIRTQLDRVYLEASSSEAVVGDRNEESSTPDSKALREELDSLYSEILPVAQMAVEQQYLEPTNRLLQKYSEQQSRRSVQTLEYVIQCLTVLSERLQAMIGVSAEFQSCRAASREILELIEAEPEDAAITRVTRSTDTSPTISKKSIKVSSPVRQRAQRRRSSVASVDEEVNAEQSILRTLGINPITDVANDNSTAAVLADAFTDRSTKLNQLSRDVQDNLEGSIASHLRDAQSTTQRLKHALLADTPFGTIRLLDVEINDAISQLQDDIDRSQRESERLNTESLRQPNVAKEAFIERWQ